MLSLPEDLRQRLDAGDWDSLLTCVTDLASFTEAFIVCDPQGQVPESLADGFYLVYAEAEGLLDEGCA